MGVAGRRTEFAERVRIVSDDAKLPITELAVKAGIPYRTLRNRLEGNAGRFSIDELDAIAEATGGPGDFDFLLSGVRPKAVA
jgi:predicted transcriptional regulator